MKYYMVNETGDGTYDVLMEKARAILIDNNHYIYVCNMEDNYLLPGGTVEKNEIPLDTIKRELEEELGLCDISLQEFACVSYYHDNFPKYKKEGFEKRLNKVTYYIGQLTSEVLIKSNLTDYEIRHKFKIEKYTLDELLVLINKANDNPWSSFANLELKYVLDLFQSYQ